MDFYGQIVISDNVYFMKPQRLTRSNCVLILSLLAQAHQNAVRALSSPEDTHNEFVAQDTATQVQSNDAQALINQATALNNAGQYDSLWTVMGASSGPIAGRSKRATLRLQPQEAGQQQLPNAVAPYTWRHCGSKERARFA